MWKAFTLLAKFKGLRGGTFDIFGYTEERKMERALITEFRGVIAELLGGLSAGNHEQAVAVANLPEKIRGFGHVKEKAVAEYQVNRAKMMAAFKAGDRAHAA